MSSSSEFVRVGKVKDAHGIKGELFIVLFAGEATWLDRLTELRLFNEETQATSQIFNLKSARLHKNGFIAKTEEIRDRNQAEALKGWSLEIPTEFLVSKSGEMIYLREVQGFRIFTEGRGEIGVINDFASNGAQDLLVVKTAWGEFEIPFVEAFVKKIDFAAREIHLALPEGLLGEEE